MSCRSCDRSLVGAPPRLPAATFRIDAGGSVPGKASTVPGGPPVIQVDRAFWARLDRGARAALVAHEIAHHEHPAACEHCTDARAGARLRHDGWTAADTARSFASIVASRPAARNALEGWAVADRAIAAKQGEHSGLMNDAERVAPRPGQMRYALDDAGAVWGRLMTGGIAAAEELARAPVVAPVTPRDMTPRLPADLLSRLPSDLSARGVPGSSSAAASSAPSSPPIVLLGVAAVVVLVVVITRK